MSSIKNLLIIGVSGVTCGGKTTVAAKLKDNLPNVTVISQDDYFLDEEDPRHVWIPDLNHVNFDIITSLDMEKMYSDILQFIKGNNFKKAHFTNRIIPHRNSTQCTTNFLTTVSDMMKETKLNLLIIEGFSIFNYKPMLDVFQLKYYFTLDREECYRRRIKRVYEPPDCPGYFENCAWPEYLNLWNEVRQTVKDVKYIDGMLKNPVNKILEDILQFL